MNLDERITHILGAQILRIAQLEANIEQLQGALEKALQPGPLPPPPPDPPAAPADAESPLT